jgi:HK97 family phage major capsid protein
VELTVSALEGMLTKFRDEIKGIVPGLVKEQSTDADGKIADLQTQLKDIELGLKKIEDVKKDNATFGLPGLEHEKKNFSWTRFFRAMYEAAASGKGSCPVINNPWKSASFEERVCKDYMQRRGVELTSFIHNPVNKDYTSGDGGEGGFLVPPEITQEIIDLAMPSMPVLNMPGIMKLTNLRGDLPVPKVLSRNTGYHLGENSAPTKSTGSFGLEWMRPKKVGAFTKQSNRLLYQTSGSSDALIKRLLAEGVAIEMHQKLITGTGSDNQPLGILNTSVVNQMTACPSNDGTQLTIDDMAQMQMKLAIANELRDTPSYGYLMRPEAFWGLLRQTVKQYSGQGRKDAAPILSGSILLDRAVIERSIGKAMRDTTHIGATDTAGGRSTSSKVIFGDWSLFWYATWRDPIFRVSDQASDGAGNSAFLEDMLYMVMFQEYDARIMRPSAFTVKSGIETNDAQWS